MLIKSKLSRFISNHHNSKYPFQFQFIRTFVDDVEIKFVRDRGLDHAVEREKDLKPMINLKNLLKLEPTNSLPLSTIVDNNETLKIPFRPIAFIRKYPSVFEEFFPANIGIHPHVKLTPKIVDLDAQEQLVFDNDNVRKNAADRLLKLLMLCRVNEIPLKLIDRLKWDLGLPDNYATSLVSEFPDYFQVKKGKGFEGFLELVCWNDELAVSVMEKMAKKTDKEYQKGMPIAFPLKFSNGFEMDNRLKKWIDEWQKLPYVSPYENASHLQPNSDESDKWVVSVLHELLHILVPKKTERDNILCVGEYLGVRSRFKRALIHHPGIFYLSSKIETHTVVLREGYKRGLLIDKHHLMDMRGKYIHLLHTVKKAEKPKHEPSGDASKPKEVAKKENEVKGNEQDDKMQAPDSDDDESDLDDDNEDEEDEEKPRGRGGNERKGSIELNENDRGRVGHRSGGGGGFSKVNEGGRGRGGHRSGGGGFGRGGHVSGGGGFSKVNDGDRGRGGFRSGRGGFNNANEVGREKGGSINIRRGFNEGQESGRSRSGRREFNEGRERGESRSGRTGFSRVNEEWKERGGARSGRSGFSKEEGQERDGGRSGRGGFSKFNVGHSRSGNRNGSGEFGNGNDEQRERNGGRSERRESGKGNDERRERNGGRSERREHGKVNEGGRNPRRISECGNSPRKHFVDS